MPDQRERRVLLVTRNMPPLVGGMEHLNWQIARQLVRTGKVRVIAPSGSAGLAPEGVETVEAPLRPLWRFLVSAATNTLGCARKWKPDVVLAGSGLTAPIALLAARACKARAVVYLHGLDIAMPHPVYRALWLPAIRRMDCVIVNSSATRKLALDSGVPEQRIAMLHPGVELPAPELEDDPGTIFRRHYGLGSGPILLSVGRLTERKGLLEFVRDVLPKVTAGQPDVQLVVVGDAANDALAARSQSRQSILQAAQAASLLERVHFIGVITDRDLLSCAYHAASVHVFPVREIPGDPEGFGMVAVEAAAHGLPTAAYATGGITDAVSDGISGRLAPPGQSDVLAGHVLALLQQPLPEVPMLEFARQFTWCRFGARLDALLR